MPRFDGTGPLGQGPMTGGGRGFCAMPYRAYGPSGYGVRAPYHSFYARPFEGPSLVQAVVGYPGVEVEAGPLVAGEAPVVRVIRWVAWRVRRDPPEGEKRAWAKIARKRITHCPKRNWCISSHERFISI